MRDPRSILITGASSGIGRALALSYAAPGRSLTLGGRDRARLAEVARLAREKGATVGEAAIDVTDRAAMAAWIEDADARQPLDLVIANAGVSAGTGRGEETDAQTTRIFDTNLTGVLNTVLPAMARLTERRRGQIALMSSLAGFRGFPGAPAYCASKAAVRVWGEALRTDLRAKGVSVSVVCPGYIATPMTDANDFPMPLLMPAAACARIIVRGLAADRARIAFPWPLYLLVGLVGALPPAWTDPLLARLPRKV
jgi:short-subunit dehydrogenase